MPSEIEGSAQIPPAADPALPPADITVAQRTAKLQMIVMAAGLTTTAISLFFVYLLNFHASVNVMGWYANYVLPVGAVLVGLVASSGYGLTSWLSGVRIRKRLLGTLLVVQALAYLAAQYIEFSSYGPLFNRATGQPVGFFEFFHYTTMTMAFKEANGKFGLPLGGWGYGLRVLEVVGFVGGSLIVPLALMRTAYCEACRLYMRTKVLALFAASVPVRKIKKSDTDAKAAYEAEQSQALANGREHVAFLQRCAQNGDAKAFRDYVAAAAPEKKAIGKLPVRISVTLVRCNGCAAGHLKATLLAGQGNQITSTELSRTELAPEFVRAISDA